MTDRPPEFLIEHHKRPGGGRYVLYGSDGEEEAWLLWKATPGGHMEALSTYVRSSLQHTGADRLLVQRLAEDARAKDIGILPSCKTVAALLKPGESWILARPAPERAFPQHGTEQQSSSPGAATDQPPEFLIEHHKRAGGGRYVLYGPDGEEAWLGWQSTSDGHIEALSTHVPSSLQHAGADRLLVQRLAKDAKAKDMGILPSCKTVARLLIPGEAWILDQSAPELALPQQETDRPSASRDVKAQPHGRQTAADLSSGSDEVTIERQSEYRGRYLIHGTDNLRAWLSWRIRSDGQMEAVGMFVPPQLRGQQLGEQLIQRLINDGRRQRRPILATCPQVQNYAGPGADLLRRPVARPEPVQYAPVPRGIKADWRHLDWLAVLLALALGLGLGLATTLTGGQGSIFGPQLPDMLSGPAFSMVLDMVMVVLPLSVALCFGRIGLAPVLHRLSKRALPLAGLLAIMAATHWSFHGLFALFAPPPSLNASPATAAAVERLVLHHAIVVFIPSLAAALVLAFAIPAFVLERLSPIDAIFRSVELLRPCVGSLLALLAPIMFVLTTLTAPVLGWIMEVFPYADLPLLVALASFPERLIQYAILPALYWRAAREREPLEHSIIHHKDRLASNLYHELNWRFSEETVYPDETESYMPQGKADKITHEPRQGGGRYYYAAELDKPAYLTWRDGQDGKIEALSTYVPQSLRGRGIAMLLTERLIADAREQGRTIVPLCSYIAHHAHKRPDWQSVVIGAAHRSGEDDA